MNNAEMLFYSIVDRGYVGITELLGREENEFLDFKRKSNGDTRADRNDKAIYATALSGFSNTLGGVIVWGIKCARDTATGVDVATELVGIDNPLGFANDLNDCLHQIMTPPNPGIQNRVILDSDDTALGFVVTYVPESDGGPHRAILGNKQYVTRIGSSFLEMNHAQLADMFGRRQRPLLKIISSPNVSTTQIGTNVTQLEVQITVGIVNEGRYLSKYPALRMREKKEFHLYPVSSLPPDYFLPGNPKWYMTQQGPLQLTRSQIHQAFYWAGRSDDVIHPGAAMDVFILRKRFEQSYLDEPKFLLDFDYELFSEGCHSVEGNFRLHSAEDLGL